VASAWPEALFVIPAEWPAERTGGAISERSWRGVLCNPLEHGIAGKVALVAPKRVRTSARGPGTPHNAAPLHRRGSSCLFLIQMADVVLFVGQPHPLVGAAIWKD